MADEKHEGEGGDVYHVPEPDFDESQFLDTLERGRAYRFGREEKVKFLKWVKLTGEPELRPQPPEQRPGFR